MRFGASIGAGQTISQPGYRPDTSSWPSLPPDKVLRSAPAPVPDCAAFRPGRTGLQRGADSPLAAVARQILAEAGVRTSRPGGRWKPGLAGLRPLRCDPGRRSGTGDSSALVAQLAPAGRLIIPLGARSAQTLTLVTRHEEGIRTERLTDVRFVPLLGQHGFADQSPRPTEPGWNY